MSDIKKRFGKRLRQLREGKGVSQEELSKLAGFDRTYVGKIERGERNPSLETIAKLAEKLEIDLIKLFKF